MAHQDLMKQGLKGLLNPETQFQEERNFGKKVYITAWIVEILAATIGLLTAAAMAWDAWRQEESQDISIAINAILGALPFLVIAVIEPTKIPLAGGLYKTRIFGWKILIFCALILLTGVTFETMFMGLERNTTNITAKVTKVEQSIQKLRDSKGKLESEQKQIEQNPESSRLDNLTQLINQERQQNRAEIDGIYAAQLEAIKPYEEAIRSAREEKERISGANSDSDNSQLKALDRQIEGITQDIEQELARAGDGISALLDQETDIRRQLQENKAARQDADRSAKNDFDSAISKAEKERAEMLKESEGLFGQVPRDKEDEIKAQYDSKIRTAEQFYNDRRSENEGLYLSTRTALNANLDQVQKKLDRIESNQIVSQLREKKAALQQKRDDLLTRITGLAQADINRLNEVIKSNEERIDRETSNAKARASSATEISSRKIQEYEEQRKRISTGVSSENDRIPELKAAVTALQEKIDIAKEEKREEAQKSQVYRLAAWYSGVEDVADVAPNEVRFVSSIWFGSIALIISTIGTVLALISHILRDPVAFEKKKKISVTRRAQRVLLVVGGRFAQMLAAIGKLIFEITKAIVAIAEIFRGLIGRPLQRSIRLCAVAIRKRMNKPKIIEKEIEVEVEKIVEKEIEVEVEKIVEKEVQVEVEVERIVEKIVEKEVPVDKIVIKEVPKEIIRKELVYVPLYSTDSGLIDSTKETLSMNPFRPTPVEPVEINRVENENIEAEPKETEPSSAQESRKPKRARNTRRRNNSDKTE